MGPHPDIMKFLLLEDLQNRGSKVSAARVGWSMTGTLTRKAVLSLFLHNDPCFPVDFKGVYKTWWPGSDQLMSPLHPWYVLHRSWYRPENLLLWWGIRIRKKVLDPIIPPPTVLLARVRMIIEAADLNAVEIDHSGYEEGSYGRECEKRVLSLRRRFALKDYLMFLRAATTVRLDSRITAYQAAFHDREFADTGASSLLLETSTVHDPGYAAASPLRVVPALGPSPTLKLAAQTKGRLPPLRAVEFRTFEPQLGDKNCPRLQIGILDRHIRGVIADHPDIFLPVYWTEKAFFSDADKARLAAAAPGSDDIAPVPWAPLTFPDGVHDGHPSIVYTDKQRAAALYGVTDPCFPIPELHDREVLAAQALIRYADRLFPWILNRWKGSRKFSAGTPDTQLERPPWWIPSARWPLQLPEVYWTFATHIQIHPVGAGADPTLGPVQLGLIRDFFQYRAERLAYSVTIATAVDHALPDPVSPLRFGSSAPPSATPSDSLELGASAVTPPSPGRAPGPKAPRPQLLVDFDSELHSAKRLRIIPVPRARNEIPAFLAAQDGPVDEFRKVEDAMAFHAISLDPAVALEFGVPERIRRQWFGGIRLELAEEFLPKIYPDFPAFDEQPRIGREVLEELTDLHKIVWYRRKDGSPIADPTTIPGFSCAPANLIDKMEGITQVGYRYIKDWSFTGFNQALLEVPVDYATVQQLLRFWYIGCLTQQSPDWGELGFPRSRSGCCSDRRRGYQALLLPLAGSRFVAPFRRCPDVESLHGPSLRLRSPEGGLRQGSPRSRPCQGVG